jgi:7-carboxy-7-deazaguanine synthase
MNVQTIEKRVVQNWTDQLQVHSIFKTIQGEGPFCGTPCVFVRLAGCNLQCPACDTDYTSKRELLTPRNISTRIDQLMKPPGLVVITGGEPFRQDLTKLFQELTASGYYVQVESNGTLPPPPWNYTRHVQLSNREGVYIVCSPKTPRLNPRILEAACALKYVVRYGMVAEDGLPLSALDMPNPPARPPEGWDRLIYVQPLDGGDVVSNDFHTTAAVDSCLKHGYTLQLQVHKLVGVE